MRLRLFPILAAVLSAAMPAAADDPDSGFDDDFGTLPAPTPPLAPSRAEPPRPVTPPPEREAVPAPVPAAPAQQPTMAATPAPSPPAGPERPIPSQRSTERPGRRLPFVHPTVSGLLGGVHTVDARSGPAGTFRVALQGQYFRRDGFLARGDRHASGGASLLVNVTPIEHLELAARLSTHSSENRTTEPRVIQVLGDTHLFAKGYGQLSPWLAAGGDVELALLHGVGALGIAGGSTSVGLRAAASADLRALPRRPLPLIARIHVRYLFDNSAKLVEEFERSGYRALDNPAPRRDEYRHLLTPAERYGLQVSRVDRLGASFGLELPLTLARDVHIHPLLEWRFDLPVNRQGYDCVVTQVPGDPDGCLDRESFAARPSTLTLGLRAQPGLPGLGLLLALDLATSGHRELVRELAPQARYLLHFALSYAYDPRPLPPPKPVVRRVEVPVADPRGRIHGAVVEAESGTPVAGARVHFENTSLSDVLTGEQGEFASAELPPGAQGMRIRADGYREALCVAVVSTAGEDVQTRCELAPSAHYGAVAGRVTDPAGGALPRARVSLRGAAEVHLTSNGEGAITAPKLPAGDYEVEVSADGHFTRVGRMRVGRGETSQVSYVLYRRPALPQVRLAPKRLILKRQVQFADASAVLSEESLPLLAEVAEVMRLQPELSPVEIGGHVEPLGEPARAEALSLQRATAVREWLVSAGIAPERLTAVGYGAARPLVPNLTPQNRAKNRRIEFVTP